MEFLIYLSTLTLCEQLQKTMIQHYRLSNFQFHYSIDDQQIIEKRLTLIMEYINETIISKQIRAQFPRAETVLLTGDHFNELIRQSMDRIIAKLRLQKGFDGLDD